MLFVFPSGLSAHPHVFITQSIQIVFNDKGLAGFKVRWQFDDMFSAMIAGDYDKNENGRLEAAEKKAIRKEAFEPLAEHNYFTFIKIDGKSFQVQYIKDFEARLENKRLQYRFLIPCHVTAISHSKKLTVATYDSTYYTAIQFADKQPVRLTDAGAFQVNTSIRKDPDTTIYYGMVHPWTLFLEFCTKP